MFGKMFNEKSHVMLKKSVYLIATISVLGWVTLAGAGAGAGDGVLFSETFTGPDVDISAAAVDDVLDLGDNTYTVVAPGEGLTVTDGALVSTGGGYDIRAEDAINHDIAADGPLTVQFDWMVPAAEGAARYAGVWFFGAESGFRVYPDLQGGAPGYSHVMVQVFGGGAKVPIPITATIEPTKFYTFTVVLTQGEAPTLTIDEVGGSNVQALTTADAAQTWTETTVTDVLYRIAGPNHNCTMDNVILSDSTAAGIAGAPSPEDQATDVLRDVVLNWAPGESANTHDVYFGTVFDDVNNATATVDPAGVYRGRQSESTYSPDRLDLGQTYYWRVDEVNAAPDYTVFTGDVWQFTAEPVGYPIENIAVTASSENGANERPGNAINGSGLDDDDLHSSDNTDMWLTNMMDPNTAWIQFEFDRSYKLYQMLVWNYNSTVEPAVGFGIKEATIEYSVDGTSFSALGATHEFAQGPGLPGYVANTAVDLSGVTARYVRITANSNWSPYGLNQFGLSEVRFLYIPVWPREPSPYSGATYVGVNTLLSFRAGREAAKHDVYLSTDEQAVIDGLATVTSVTEPGYAPSLDLASTYYWRIDEVNDAETPTTWQSDIWSLSTQEYLVVDDFESYNDIPVEEEGSKLVYGIWKDGFDNPIVNGSTMGYTEAFQPSMETSVAHDGSQSAPLIYNNTAATYSEVTANIADLQVTQDWTRYGIKALTLRFFGDPTNVAQQMYVKLNGTKIAYDGSAENIRLPGWQMWYIDLASTGVDLSNVTELSVGFERIGAAGGQGMVLIDAIRLYSYDRQLITPVDPGAVGLQAHYEFEGNTNDSSGNARNGTVMGNPTFVEGKIGQAINLRGLNDYVEITGYKGILGPDPFSISAWINTSDVEGTIVGWGSTPGGTTRVEFRINDDRLRCESSGNVQGNTTLPDNEWIHVSVTVKAGAVIDDPDVTLYLDGQNDTMASTGSQNPLEMAAGYDVTIGRRHSDESRWFDALIDDVRIYNYELSQQEVAGLAGRTKPFDKLF